MAFLFSDTFSVQSVDNSRFDAAARLTGTSVPGSSDSTLAIDINNKIWPLASGEKIQVSLARADVAKSIKADFEYVMNGKVTKVEATKSAESAAATTLHASYGGLLMKLQSSTTQFKDFQKRDGICFLAKRVARGESGAVKKLRLGGATAGAQAKKQKIIAEAADKK